MNNNSEIYSKIQEMLRDSELREREFYPDFSRMWKEVFKLSLSGIADYFPSDKDNVLTVPCSGFPELGLEFHIDQLKIYEWYQKELSNKKKVVFEAKRFARRRNGEIHYDNVICNYDITLPEPALNENMKNIVACAFPGSDPDLRIVYGNKWVEKKFNILLQSRLSLFLIKTDYVPAFLASPFEVCAYLFLMDYCIIKGNVPKVKDSDLRKILHIFRPSPMLMVKGFMNRK